MVRQIGAESGTLYFAVLHFPWVFPFADVREPSKFGEMGGKIPPYPDVPPHFRGRVGRQIAGHHDRDGGQRGDRESGTRRYLGTRCVRLRCGLRSTAGCPEGVLTLR